MDRDGVLNNKEALRLIQGIVGLTLVVMGLYIVGPWYVTIPDSAAFSTVIDVAGLYVKTTAALQFVTGAAIVWGAARGNSLPAVIGIWGGVSMYSLIVVMRLITIGFVPIVWVPQLALMLICAVLALAVRRR